MKTLLVSAQDIRFIGFGLVEDGALTREAEERVPPERYLEALDRTLAAWKIEPKDFAAVAVVAGPGAFTASRVSTVIANTVAFVAGVPVMPIENPERRPLRDLAASLSKNAFPPVAFAVPVYDREPNITRKSRAPC